MTLLARFLLGVGVVGSLALAALPALAIDPDPGPGGGGGIEDPLAGVGSIADLLVSFAEWLLGLVAILALIGIIVSGIRMILSVGNEQGIASAKRILLWSVAGLIISVLALAIVFTVTSEILNVGLNSLPGIPTAHAVDIGLDKALETGLEPLTPGEIAIDVVSFVTGLAAILTLAVFIFGAVMMVVSLGNDQRVATAKRIMLYAIVGLILIGVAFVVVNLVGQLLGVEAGG